MGTRVGTGEGLRVGTGEGCGVEVGRGVGLKVGWWDGPTVESQNVAPVLRAQRAAGHAEHAPAVASASE